MRISKRVKQHGRYDRSLKREVARRYLAGEFSYRIAAEEYGLSPGGVVKEFVRWYRRQDDYLEGMKANKPTAQSNKTSDDLGDNFSVSLDELSHEELKALVIRLRAECDEARLAVQAWRSLIDIAEQSLNIEIVKKSVAKPSAK